MRTKYFKLVFTLSILLVVTITLIATAKSIARLIFPLGYREHILNYSQEYGVDPYLVAAVIKAESNFKNKAQSEKNAKGLMQLMDETAKWISVQLKDEDFKIENIYEPEVNIRYGCWYLNNLGKEFNGNVNLVLAAYNGGSGNVKSWLKNKNYSKDGKNLDYIPFKETDKYVKRVRVNYNIYKYLYPNFSE